MTPERQKWWDSLPSYEKQARNAIKESKRKIKWAKEELPYSFGPYGEAMKEGLRRNKFLIKVLHKEIAQRPVIRTQPATASPYKCPCCGASLMYLLRCAECGQKLRWKQ